LEAGWQIRRSQQLADNEVVVRRHSKVMGNQAPISLTFDISTVYPMRYQVTSKRYTPQGAAQAPRPGQNYLLEIMQGGDEMTQAEICEKAGKSKSTVSRQIKQLEAAGAIVHMPSGKYKIMS
jgi:predicted HTH transcriptional regulator